MCTTALNPSFGKQPAEFEVSVIIAVYNGESSLERAVLSAVEACECSIELVVIDDCSTDGTWDLVKRLEGTTPYLRVFRMAVNSGPSAARNIGIEAAKGAWVCVLDADDTLVPGRLSRLMRLAASDGSDAFVDRIQILGNRSGERSRPLPRSSWSPRMTAIEYVSRSHPYTGDLDYGLLKPLLRRSFLVEHGLRYRDDVRHGEDFLLMFGLLELGGRLRMVKEVGYLYTSRESGLSRTRPDYMGMARISRELARAANWRVAARLEARANALEKFHRKSSGRLRLNKSHNRKVAFFLLLPSKAINACRRLKTTLISVSFSWFT